MPDQWAAPAGARLARIPIDFVVSEVGAFPIASVESLRRPVEALDPNVGSFREGTTARLWRAAERELLRALPGVSIDEIVQIRDNLWFGQHPSTPVPLGQYLRSVAAGFTDLRASSDPTDVAPGPVWRRRRLWTGLSLPPDLLIAAGGTLDELTVRMSPPLDRSLSDNGFAETHLHLGAAMDFGLLWGLLVLAARDFDFASDLFTGPGADLDEGRDLARWLLPALVTRVVLARHWASGRPRFADTVADAIVPDVTRRLGATAEATLRDCLASLMAGRPAMSVDFSRLRALYRYVCSPGPGRGGVTTARQVWERDPVADLVGWAPGPVTPEQCLMERLLAFLDTPAGADDRDAQRLFWQTVRVRNLVYRHITHRPMVPGLQWFVRFYGRLVQAKRGVDMGLLLESAASTCGAGRGLRSLEIRTSPALTIEDQLADVKRVASFAKHHGELEVGLVLHFVKDRGGGALEGTPLANWRHSNADPLADFALTEIRNSGYRYATYFRRLRTQALVLSTTLRRWPRALYVVRGVDACTDELGIPAWVLRPAMRMITDAATAARQALRAACHDDPGFGITVHAGEDFVHLLTGFRNVDAAIRRYELSEGHRIGHGIALGVDAATWAHQVGRVAVAREERLFDLAWEWTWYARRAEAVDVARIAYLEREVSRLSHSCWGRAVTPRAIEVLFGRLADPKALVSVGFPDGPRPQGALSQDDEILVGYLSDPHWFQRGRALEWVDPHREVDALQSIQRGLRLEVGLKGLVVEVNPTSNLLIGDLGDLSGHPLWRLRPPRASLEGREPEVSVCIGSDDPIVFNSHLRGEYQLLYDALVMSGISDQEARGWLDRTRSDGMAARFTVECADLRTAPSPEDWITGLRGPEPLVGRGVL